jgi:hypothetical protein
MESKAEIARLQLLISSQSQAQQILESQLATMSQKLTDYDEVTRKRRGSEMALASLGEQHRLMEEQYRTIQAQLLESQAAVGLVEQQMRENEQYKETMAKLMESHGSFTAAYEMRVAELESENGELHGFMSALLNDPTKGMLAAVLGFYRQRYYVGGEFKGATIVVDEDGQAQELAREVAQDRSEEEAEEEEYGDEITYDPRLYAEPAGSTSPPEPRSPPQQMTKVRSPQQPSSVVPDTPEAPPRYATDTMTSSITKRVTKLALDDETRSRRDSWFSGGRVSPNGEMIMHATRTQEPDTKRIVEEMLADHTEDVSSRAKGFHDPTKINHHHIQGVSMGGHDTIVNDNKRKMREMRRKEARSLSPTRTPGIKLQPQTGGRDATTPRRRKKPADEMTPIRWFMALDAQSGIHYWYQPWTGETTWNKPPGFDESRAVYSPPKVYKGPPADLDESLASSLGGL